MAFILQNFISDIRGKHSFKGALSDVYNDNKNFLIIILAILVVWAVATNIVYHFIDGPPITTSERVAKYGNSMISRIVLFLSAVCFVKLILFLKNQAQQKTASPLLDTVRNDPYRYMRAAILLPIGIISFAVLQTNFMSIKTAIPAIQPFYLDEWASKADRVLFFGHDAWTLFSWIYDIPALIKIIDLNYTLWVSIVAGLWIYSFIGESISRARRYQYIFSMIFIWFIAGNIFAILLSSVGPCYYGYFTGDHQLYGPLVDRLASLDDKMYLNAVTYQKFLLWMYENPETRFGGISAIPSLHVGTSLIMLFYFWKNEVLRILLITFNVLVYIGSIALAWHYAIDGIIAAPIAVFCWWLAGIVSRKIDNASPSSTAATA